MRKYAWQEHLGEVKCPRCNHKYFKPEFGFYECSYCGFHENVEQALTRCYYEQSEGIITKKEIAEYAGMSEEFVEAVNKGLGAELEMLELDRRTCVKCGEVIMYGRYCEKCKWELLGDIRRTYRK